MAQMERNLPAVPETGVRSVRGWGRFPGKGSENPLQYSRLENSIFAWARIIIVHGVAKSRTQLNDSHELWPGT